MGCIWLGNVEIQSGQSGPLNDSVAEVVKGVGVMGVDSKEAISAVVDLWKLKEF